MTSRIILKHKKCAIKRSKVPDYFKTQEMCDKEVEKGPWSSVEVPDHFKTQEMCNKAV